EFIPVMTQEALYRPRGGFTEPTDGVALDLAGGLAQHLQVFDRGAHVDHAADHAVHPAGAFTARGALATAFLIVETRDALAGADHAGGLVHDDHRAGAEAGAGLLQRVVIHGQAHHGLARQHRHRGSTRDHTLD